MKPADLPDYVQKAEPSTSVVRVKQEKQEKQEVPPQTTPDFLHGYEVVVSGKKPKKSILKHVESQYEVILPKIEGVEWVVQESADGSGDTIFDGTEDLLCWKIVADAFPEVAGIMKQGSKKDRKTTRPKVQPKAPAGTPYAPKLLPGMKGGLWGVGLGWAVQAFLRIFPE